MKRCIFSSIVLVIICMLIFSCQKENLEGSFYLRLNDTICVKERVLYVNHDDGISIRLDSVPNDSRCPPWAMCVWQGNATVAFTFTKENCKHSLILNTFSAYPSDTLIEGYNIKLINLNWPEIGELRPKAYIASILIRK